MAKIAYLTPLYFADESCIGGGERYPTNLARGVAIASDGRHEVDLISFGPAAAASIRPVAPGVRLRVLEATSPPKNPLDVLSWELPGALAEADLVHIHQAYTRCTEVGMLVAKALRKPVALTDHGGQTSRIGEYSGIAELADAIVAYSDFGASFYRTARPVSVIKGGVDVSAFTPSETPTPREHVSYVGRLLPHKGVDRLIRAVPDDLALVVCGRVYHAEYHAHLVALARGKRVTFVTDADDAGIVDIYRRSWANVLPSVHTDCYGNDFAAPELMGFTLLEAMACGTPGIASNLAAMPEFVRPGETGEVFDDEAQLRDYLVRLAGDPGLVERMGREARRVVAAEYAIEVAGAGMVDLYDRMIAAAAGTGLAAIGGVAA